MTTEAPEAVLGEDEIRRLLRECVTVVKPGETLILRCPEEWTAAQVGVMQDYATQWLADYAPDVRAFVVPHLEIAVIEPEPDAAFLERLERAWPEMTRRQMKRQAANWTERR